MNNYLTSQERRLIIGIVLVLATGTIVRYHARHGIFGQPAHAPAKTLNHDAETRF